MQEYRLKPSVLACACTATLLVLSGCASPQAKEAKYLEQGKREFQSKNYAIAVLHLKSAIQAQPKDAEPYYQLGLVYLAAGDFNPGASYLRKAVELNPQHTGAQLKLAELMASSRSREIVEEAQKRTEDVLNLLPGDVDALNVLALTELRLGKPESAEAHLQQALLKSPGHLRSSVALAQTRLARKDLAGAEEALKQAAARAPGSPEPCDYLGGFYVALGRTAEAEQQFRRALEIDPKHGPALLSMGAMQAQAGHLDQADKTYRQVAGLPQKQYRPVHALFLFQSGRRDEAVEEFEKLAKSDPSDRTLRTHLVRAYFSVNRVGDAIKVLTAALKKNPVDADALMQRSRIYLAWGNYNESRADLHQVLHFRNDSPEAHYLLAKVEQAQGDARIPRQELGEALRLDPAYLAARIDLARALIGGGGAQAAMALLEEAPAEQKSTLAFVLQRNWALLALGQIPQARAGIDQILNAGKNPDGLLQDAVLKLIQKDYAGSRISAEGVLRLNPEDTRALGVLVQGYSAQNQLPAGLDKAREQAVREPKSAAVQAFLGQLLLNNGDRAGARAAFSAARAANPNLLAADLALAQLDIAEGRKEEASKRIIAAVSLHPDSVPGQMLWGELEAMYGRNASAIEHYRKANVMDPRNFQALNNLAYLLSENNQPDEALKYAQQAKELAPDNPAVDDTLGWTYYQKALYPLAVSHLQSAVTREGTARRRYHLAMAYLKAGDTNRGRQSLETALKMDPLLVEAQGAQQLFGNPKR